MRKFQIKYFAFLLILLMAGICVQAQEAKTIYGKVISDEDEIGISNVSISLVKGDKVVGTTDINGAFTVSAEKGAQIRFSAIGYTTVTYTIRNTDSILIRMKTDVKSIDAVVVEGFTEKSKTLQTSVSTRVDGDVVRLAPAANFVDLLQGRVAGVNIQNNNGAPGSIGTINMRGVSTLGVSSDGLITPTSPLFVIDGVQVDANSNYEYGFQSGGTGINPLALIPQDDIESIDFLRDAAAISQYGSRGAYGVVIVTTKRGRSKVPIVLYSSSFFVSRPPSLIQTIGGRRERAIHINSILNYDTAYHEISKAQANLISAISDSLNPYYNNSTNWQGIYFGSTFNQSHNLNISGGDNTFSYKTNLNYYNEKGIIKNTDLRRYALGMQTRYMPDLRFRVVANITLGLGEKGNGSGTGRLQTGVAKTAQSSSLLPRPTLFSPNSAALEDDRANNLNRTSSINASLDVNYEFVKGLAINNLVSYNYALNSNSRFTSAYFSGNSSDLFLVDQRNYNLQDRVRLQYTYQFRKHGGYLYAFNEITSYGNRTDATQINGTPNDQILGPIGNIYGNSKGGTYGVDDVRTHGYGGWFSYNFDRRYAIDLGFRRDNTSSNGPSRGYIDNPALAAKWNFFLEKFAPRWLSNGAIRVSWAQVIRPVGTIFDVYGRYVVGDFYNNNPTVNINFNTVPNPNFSPEQREDRNLGIDLGFFRDNVSLSVDIYEKISRNQVIDQKLNSSVNAFSNFSVNGGTVVNRGVEFSLNAVVLDKEDWKLNFNYNMSFDRSRLVALPGGVRELRKEIKDAGVYIPVVQRVGLSQFSNLLFVNKGVYASTSDVPVNPATGERLKMGRDGNSYFKAGDPIWLDVNGDYVIDDNDLVNIGNPIPLIVGGFNPVLRYRRFTLTASLVFTLKRDIINQVKAGQLKAYTDPLNAGGVENANLQPIENFNYWKPINGDLDNGTVGAIYPNPFDWRRAKAIDPYRYNQDLYIEDGSYAKINVINLGYDVNPEFVQKYGVTQIRLQASVSNVYTFTKYSGVNPESVTQLGRDLSSYPNARRYNFGVNVRF